MLRHHRETSARGALCAAAAALTVSLAVSAAAVAEENQIGAVPALEFPVQERDATPFDDILVSDSLRVATTLAFRGEIEKAGDTALCNVAMEVRYRNDQAQLGELRAADEDFCDADLKEAVANDGGGLVDLPVVWDDGARPKECGHSCLSAPINTQALSVDRPNLRQVVMYGTIALRIPKLGHRMSLGYELRFTCQADDGARRGVVTPAVKLDSSFVHESGTIENVTEFFTTVDVSNLIADFIDSKLAGESLSIPELSELDDCVSIGAVQDASNPVNDTVRWSLPGRTLAPGVAEAFGDRTTVRLLSIRRLPPSELAASTPLTTPGRGDFTLYANGERVAIPRPIGDDPEPLLLTEGETVTLNMCKTVDTSGANTLQLVFANGAGTAAWSELARAADFGEGAAHTIQTGRTIILPERDGPTDPLTGRPTRIPPTPYILREFELAFQVSFEPSSGPTLTTSDQPTGIAGGMATDVNRAPDLTPAASGRRVAPGLANSAGRVTAPAVSGASVGRVAPGLSGANVVQAELACREI